MCICIFTSELAHATGEFVSVNKLLFTIFLLFSFYDHIEILLVLLNIRTLGWDPKEGESHLDVMLRSLLLIALVKLGHDETINEGVRRFHIFIKDRKTNILPPDTRKVQAFA